MLQFLARSRGRCRSLRASFSLSTIATAAALIALACQASGSSSLSPVATSGPPTSSQADAPEASSADEKAVLEAGSSVSLALGESAIVAIRGIRVRFVRVVEDSRCARGVTCVWAGRAVVELALESKAPDAEELVQLEVGVRGDSGSRSRNGEGLPAAKATAGATGARMLADLIAEALDPYPEAGRETPAEEIRLRLALAPEDPPAPVDR